MNYDKFFQYLQTTKLNSFIDEFSKSISGAWDPQGNSDIPGWMQAVAGLPDVVISQKDFSGSVVRLGVESDLSGFDRDEFVKNLMALHPWRKGPFDILGIHIDTEWRSDWKWERLEGEIAPLTGRTVLDIGCGSGYHCWRMFGSGAETVLGIEPALVYAMQFEVTQIYAQKQNVCVLPMGVQKLPEDMSVFDSVFSMGLLYHRRDPNEHLKQLWGCLRSGGELILETLVTDGPSGEVLKPTERYAQMRNVWNIPSLSTLEGWLEKFGFKKVRCIDVTQTSIDEQRTTPWMKFQSLKDFLDSNDSQKTVEGYPAPRRAIFLAEKP